MKAGTPSRTAEYNALFRALENRASRRVLADPTAEDLLSPPLSLIARVARVRPIGALITSYIDRRWPGVRTSVIARSAIIDQRVTAALNSGVAQLVVLGAGLDHRVARLAPTQSNFTVFELDHPDTQRAKLARLADSTHRHRATRYVPADFGRCDLHDVLLGHGFDAAASTVIVWEGVSNYLDADTVETMLRWCCERPSSELHFTYVDRAVLEHPERYVGTTNLSRSLARAGERLTFGTTPDEIRAYVEARGMSVIDDRSARDYRRDVYEPDAMSIRGHEFYRLAHLSSRTPWSARMPPTRSAGEPGAARPVTT